MHSLGEALPALTAVPGRCRLLMYLAPDRVAQLLREVAAASAPGSVLLAVSITDSMLASIKARGAKSSLMATWKFGCPHDPTQVSQ